MKPLILEFSNVSRSGDDLIINPVVNRIITTRNPKTLRRIAEIDRPMLAGEIVTCADAIDEDRQHEMFAEHLPKRSIRRHRWVITDGYNVSLVASEDVPVETRQATILVADSPFGDLALKMCAHIAAEALQVMNDHRHQTGEWDSYHEFMLVGGDNAIQHLKMRFPWQRDLSLSDRIRRIIKSRVYHQGNGWGTKPKKTQEVIDLRERRARSTLRKLVGDREYYSYRRKGFVSVRCKSGLTYVLYPGNKHSNVFDNKGKHIHDICMIFDEEYAPSDSIVMRLVLLLADEQDFITKANKHTANESLWNNEFLKVLQSTLKDAEDRQPTLAELFTDIKEKRGVWSQVLPDKWIESKNWTSDLEAA